MNSNSRHSRHRPTSHLTNTPGPRRPERNERLRHDCAVDFLLRLEDAWEAAFRRAIAANRHDTH